MPEGNHVRTTLEDPHVGMVEGSEESIPPQATRLTSCIEDTNIPVHTVSNKRDAVAFGMM